MAGPHAVGRAGKVNGLWRAGPAPSRRFRVPARTGWPLLALGASLYTVAMVFPLLLRQVSEAIFALALVATGFVLIGLHVRWNGRSTS